MRSAISEACRLWFGITMTSTLLLLGIIMNIVSLFETCGLLSQLRRHDLAVSIAAVVFRGFLLINPQIRIKQFDVDWDQLAASAPAMILMNHSSYFDFFLFTAMLPPFVIRRAHVRTVISAALTRLPMVGKCVGEHAGSFSVFFQAKGAGFGKGDASDFSVDRERQQTETERMEAHIEKMGGTIALCPEGGMNKTPSEGLNPFRRGSFAQAAKYSTPIWGAALHGCTSAWPRDAKIGGYPCVVALSLKKLLVPTPDATAAELAEASQKAMQQQLDELAQYVGGKAKSQ